MRLMLKASDPTGSTSSSGSPQESQGKPIVPDDATLRSLEERLDLETARVYYDDQRILAGMRDHYARLQQKEVELEMELERLAPLARAVTEGDAPLSQKNAIAMMDYRDTLARLQDVREAMRIEAGAQDRRGSLPPPGHLYG